MFVFGWREAHPCPAHPGRVCVLKWVPVFEQVEMFPSGSLGGDGDGLTSLGVGGRLTEELA